jgi:hypothetical protein
MKKVLFICLILFLPFHLMAQLKVGLKGGVNMSWFRAKEVISDDYQLNVSDASKLGYHIGLFTRISFLGVYVQPELLYTALRSETEIYDRITQTNLEPAQQQIGRIDVPALVGARFGPARLGLGPIASVIVLNRNELEDLTGYKEKLKTATVGFQAGVGIDVSSFSVDIRYEGNLSKLGDSMHMGDQKINFDKRARQVIFSLGLSF